MNFFTKFISHLFGKFAYLRLGFVSRFLILIFAKIFKVNLDESEKSISEFDSFGEFFIRKLKGGIRPIGLSPLHPCDSTISTFGKINDRLLIQAKGKKYKLDELLNNKNANYSFYITYYLSPKDYHRVHSPISGYIKRATIIPGGLLPVNFPTVNLINNLFVRNERLIVEIDGDEKVCVVFVGATNVGSIHVGFDKSLVTNKSIKNVLSKNYDVEISAGDELGYFSLGSTVIVLYEKSHFPNLTSQSVLVNTSISS